MQDFKTTMAFIGTQFLTIWSLEDKNTITFFLGAIGSLVLTVYYILKIWEKIKNK